MQSGRGRGGERSPAAPLPSLARWRSDTPPRVRGFAVLEADRVQQRAGSGSKRRACRQLPNRFQLRTRRRNNWRA